MKKTDYPIGSISSGTMREEDLIPDFVWELRHLAKAHNRKDHLALCEEIQRNIDAHLDWEDGLDTGHEYFNTDESGYDLNESLFDALNEYAAPYFYFGSHPGDGADYGYWLSDTLEDDFDGLKVSDLSEVPKDYAGEILYANDHGNISLYVKAKTQNPREIWAIV